ncbi:MAG: MFS transporter [Acidobacteriota bacterium]|nr:MFS transporter [Acidobacteriota bacterium]
MTEQRWLRVIPVAFIMYTIAFVDRTNISLALHSMSRDLHMTPTEAGNAAGVFFWGYLVLQIPGGYLAERWSAKRVVSILLVAWGLCSIATAFVHTSAGFWWMRLLLGVAEGGVWPATLILLANWFPSRERARANAYWMLCLPVAVVVSSPLSGWILGRWNWRVLLVAEGVLPLIWLLIWLTMIDDKPADAKWISREEREFLEETLSRELAQRPTKAKGGVKAALMHRQVLLMVGIYFLVNFGNYGYLFWLPSALEHARKLSSLRVGMLFAVPYAITAVGMVLISKHSDHRHERRRHVAFGLAWGGLFLIGSVLTSAASPVASFLLIAVVGAGTYGMLGPFWAIPTETLPEGVAGPAMGLINALGNLGGFFGPLVVGYLNQQTGSFVGAFATLGVGWLVAAALSVAFLPRLRALPNSTLE